MSERELQKPEKVLEDLIARAYRWKIYWDL